MLLGLSDNLPDLVEARYRNAKATQSLTFSPSKLAIIETSTGIPFQLRFCPTLAKKPQPLKQNATPRKKPDPFDNPSTDLHIVDIPTPSPSHLLVLNKFPIIAEHFIIATKTNKQQTHALEQDDLEATYACLKAWQGSTGDGQQKRLFAFFNSGEHSGASQPHRHIQFLPVESVRADQQSDGWSLLLDLISANAELGGHDAPSQLLQNPEVPFTHFAFRLPTELAPGQLLKVYHDLYHAAEKTVDEYTKTSPQDFALHAVENGSLPISYNLAMTTTAMAIMPRRNEGSMLRRDDGSEIGFVALNGTTLGGTLMVKHEEEWNELRARPEKLDAILKDIGFPATSQRERKDERPSSSI